MSLYLYHPIAKDPQGEFETFDEKLDALIRRRVQLAADFLSPMPQVEELGNELFGNLLGNVDNPLPTVKPRPLTIADVRRFSGYDFEVLVAAIEKHSSRKVILTPQSGDGGIDVISLAKNKLRLIQCKHTQWGGKVDADVVAEVITALDGYRAKYLRKFKGQFVFQAVVFTNGEFTKSARAEAKDKGVEMMAWDELQKSLESTQISQWDINEMLSGRSASMADVSAALASLLS